MKKKNRNRPQPAERPPAVHVVSLGCSKNLVDTELICGSLGSAGFAFAEELEDADLLLINTCGFIEPACEEAREEVRRGIQWKKQGQARYLAVAGCWVQRYGDQVRRDYPGIDLLLDLNAIPQSAELIAALFQGASGPEAGLSGARAAYLADEQAPRLLLTPPSHGFLKIAEGCGHGCRFCTIPMIRGGLRSRSVSSLVAEAQTLLDCGVREINLIAQDTTQYGRDRTDGADLPRLLQALDELHGEEYWLRLLYTHPAHFSEGVIAALAACRHVLPYVDMPLQHISDSVLEAMGRRTPAADIRALLSRLRARIPNVALRTTFLLGYPGETEDDFAELLEFIREVRFDRLGCFAFSPEEGTVAARLHEEDPVPLALAEERRDQVMRVQQGIAREMNEAQLGRELTVLVDGQTEEGDILARSAKDAPDVDNRVILPPESVSGEPQFLRVRVTQAGVYDLAAEAVAEQ